MTIFGMCLIVAGFFTGAGEVVLAGFGVILISLILRQ